MPYNAEIWHALQGWTNFFSKGAQKSMLKARNFTKNKICHRCFDNNLQKLFQTKSLKNSNG